MIARRILVGINGRSAASPRSSMCFRVPSRRFFFCFPRGEQVREKESNTDDELYDELHSMGNMRMIQQQQQQQYRSSI
jgi:hypothetical protein